jgi:uncharacterized protein
MKTGCRRRFVLDTNVVVSALLFRAETSKLQEFWAAGRFRLVASPMMLDEYRRVLAYPRFGLSPEESSGLMVAHVLPFCDIVEVEPGPPVCRDENDDMFLYAAVAARADAIVSGDKDVLVLGPEFQGIPILTARQAIALMLTP